MKQQEGEPLLTGMMTDQAAMALASPWRRLWAGLLDLVVMGVIFAATATAIVLAYLLIATPWSTEDESHVEGWVFVGIVFFAVGLGVVAAIIFQFIMILMVAKHGQTLGKRLLKVQVIWDGNGELGFRRALVRELLGKWIVWIVFSASLYYLVGFVWEWIPFLWEIIVFFGGAFVPGLILSPLFSFVWIFLGRDRQALHDRIAGTYVVRV